MSEFETELTIDEDETDPNLIDRSESDDGDDVINDFDDGDFVANDDDEDLADCQNDSNDVIGGVVGDDDVRRRCTVCNVAFYSMRQLSDHLRDVHAVDKPFQCNICKARFPYSSSLYNHSRIHSNRKPFKCDQCEASFRWKNSLKHHKRYIHKTINMEKLNDTTFASTSRAIAAMKGIKKKRATRRAANNGASPLESLSLPAAAKLNTIVVRPVGAYHVIINKPSAANQRQAAMTSSPTANTNNKSNVSSSPSLLHGQNEIVVHDHREAADPATMRTCGHCGRQFQFWGALARHVTKCEKTMAAAAAPSAATVTPGNAILLTLRGLAAASKNQITSSPSAAASRSDDVVVADYERDDVVDVKPAAAALMAQAAATKSSPQNNSAVAMETAASPASKHSQVVNNGFCRVGEGCQCCCHGNGNLEEFRRKLDEMERKYAELERSTSERITKLEATVADLYEVAAEMDEENM